jgi:hypothetical protein
MEGFNLALKNVQGTMQEISTTISNIYKIVPSGFIPNTLREAHGQIESLNFEPKQKGNALPLIRPKHIRSQTTESAQVTAFDPLSQKSTQTARDKFQILATPARVSRLHSKQIYRRPKFTRMANARVVPKATRFDPVANPADITLEERDQGLFNIMNRGLVSRDADLTGLFELPSLQTKKVQLNQFTSQFQTPETERKLFTTAVETTVKRKRRAEVESPDVSLLGEQDNSTNKKKDRNIKNTQERYFLIFKRGKVKQNSDYLNFRKTFKKWRNLDEVITQVEEFCKKARYPKVIIDGKKLFESENDEVQHLTVQKFKRFILNLPEVQNMMKSHKVAYRGTAGKHLAAVKIQTAFRTFYAARQYRHLRALNIKAKIIQLYFRLYLKKLETKKNIKKVRQERVEQFNRRQQAFKNIWPRMKNEERVEIHLGSLSPDTTKNFFYAKQNVQLMRVFGLTDPLVSIVYVSPVALHSDITEYYYSVLTLCEIPEVRKRLTFITPNHGISLNSLYSTSKLLFLSSSTLNEIKEMIKGKNAYMVPNETTEDDIWLTDLLNIPMMSGEPGLVYDLSTKIGCTDIFKSIGIKLPLHVSNIETHESFYKTFSSLIYENLHIDVWMIKINTEVRSRGIAYLDVTKLKSVVKIRRMETMKEEFSGEILQELVKALPIVVKFVMLSLWETWNSFLNAFCNFGGIIQETPTTRSNIASPCICVLIEPDGGIRYLCAVDRMQSRDYLNTGVFFPQASLPHSEILEIGWKVGKELYSRNVIGFACIELVAFPDPFNDGGLPVYWGIDIRLNVGIVISSYFMFHTLVGGFVEPNSGKYYIEFEEQEDEFTIVEDLFGDNFTNLLTTSKPTRARNFYEKPRMIKGEGQEDEKNVEDFNKFDERCYFLCWHIEHPDLKDLSIGGLFHMCRLESMTYSLETCKGAVFTIYEILASHHFGILGIGNNRQDSIRVLSETFTFILQQAGPPPQPPTAFKAPAKEDYNLNELITKVKSIHKTLEKINKSGKKNYLVELL